MTGVTGFCSLHRYVLFFLHRACGLFCCLDYASHRCFEYKLRICSEPKVLWSSILVIPWPNFFILFTTPHRAHMVALHIVQVHASWSFFCLMVSQYLMYARPLARYSRKKEVPQTCDTSTQLILNCKTLLAIHPLNFLLNLPKCFSVKYSCIFKFWYRIAFIVWDCSPFKITISGL